MYYTVYKIVNQINGKIYIGVHKTDNLDDGYMGSGKHLIRAQDKYGIENFKKEYLSIFDNEEEMFRMESQLVNSDFIKRKDTYNIKEGGFGGFEYINGNKLLFKKNIKRLMSYNKSSYCLETLKSARVIWHKKLKDPKVYKELCKKLSIVKKEYDLSHLGTSLGKSHTAETKEKMRQRKLGKGIGKDNTQYGTVWIFNKSLQQNKKIKIHQFEEYSLNGWMRGRKVEYSRK